MKEMAAMQALLPALPEELYLLNRVAHSTDSVAQIGSQRGYRGVYLARAGTHDFAGIYAGGEIFRGFANSFG